jgi:ABC-type sugar transport system ATPase subunit
LASCNTTQQRGSTPGPPSGVDELSLSITDGELLVLVGPVRIRASRRRCGMLAGLEPLDAGHVLIGGKDVSAVRPRDRDIAMVFQNYALYPQLNVAANMGFALKQQGVRKEERLERVREVAKLLDLEPYLDRKPRNLSGGQRQRVAMGRAIVRQPQVFLMDEPLSNLDAKLRVPDTHGAGRAAEAACGDDGLRHPRSGRGDDDGPTVSRYSEKGVCSSATRRRLSTMLRRTCSSPASSAPRP